MDNGRSVAYTYDALARLSTATTTGSSGYPAWGLQWTYDRYGDRTAQSIASGCSGVSCPTNSVTVSASTNQITTSGYGYDSNGNMTNDGYNTLSYDAENHLLTASNSLTSGAYVYDGNGLRVEKCVPNCTNPTTSTVYIFSGSKVITEYDNGAAPGSPSREYIYSGSQLIATLSGSTTVYHHPDNLSVRASSDGTANSPTYGQKIGEQGHFPFGEAWYAANTTTKWEFTTYERDAESGNDYAMARHYNSRLGRFMSPDSLAGNTSNPQSLNRYTYALNSPTNLVDPTGRDTCANSASLLKQAIVGMGLGDGFAMWLEQDDGCQTNCAIWVDGTLTCTVYDTSLTFGSGEGEYTPDEGAQWVDTCAPIEIAGGLVDPCNPLGDPQGLPPNFQSGLPGGGSGGAGAAGFGSSLDTPPPPPTSDCVVTGRVTGVATGAGQAPGKGAFGFVPPAGSVAIDPEVIGLPPGPGTNAILGPYASQISFSFSPVPTVPLGFPTTHTLGSILDPKARAGGIYFHGLYTFDVFGYPSFPTARAATVPKAQVTITFPSTLPLNCGGVLADPVLTPGIG